MSKVEAISLLTAERFYFGSYAETAEFLGVSLSNVRMACSKYRYGTYSYRIGLMWHVRSDDIGEPWPIDVLSEPLNLTDSGEVVRYPVTVVSDLRTGTVNEFHTNQAAAASLNVSTGYLRNFIYANGVERDFLYKERLAVYKKPPSVRRIATATVGDISKVTLTDTTVGEHKMFTNAQHIASYLNLAVDAVNARLYALTEYARTVPLAGRYTVNHNLSE